MATMEDQIDEWFTCRVPTKAQTESLVEIHIAARDLAKIINEFCPDGADKSAAFRLLRECAMTARAAVVLPPMMISTYTK